MESTYLNTKQSVGNTLSVLKHGNAREVYSLPGVLVIGRYEDMDYQLTACLTIGNFRLVVFRNKGTPRKINMIPYSLGGDIVEEIYDDYVEKNMKIKSLLNRSILAALFLGGYVIVLTNTYEVEPDPLTLFFPSNKLDYFLTVECVHDSLIPRYELDKLVMIGYLLQKGEIEYLMKYCSREKHVCSIESDQCVSFNTWRCRQLVVCNKGSVPLEKTIKVTIDNNPLRHVVIVDD